MNRLLANIFDTYGLYDLHKNKSRISHFSKSNDPCISLDDLNSFHPVPSTPDIIFEQNDFKDDYSLGKYKFKSEITGNGDSNAYSIGEYCKSKKVKNDTSVILVHGWRMDSFDRINSIYLQAFKNAGNNIFTFTLPHHFERTTNDSLYNGEFMISANIDRSLLSVKQAITDLRALIRYLKEKNSHAVPPVQRVV